MERIRIDYNSIDVLNAPIPSDIEGTTAPVPTLEEAPLNGRLLMMRARALGTGLGLRSNEMIQRSVKLVSHKKNIPEEVLGRQPLAKAPVVEAQIQIPNRPKGGLSNLSKTMRPTVETLLRTPLPQILVEEVPPAATAMPIPEIRFENKTLKPVEPLRLHENVSHFEAVGATLVDIVISCGAGLAALLFSSLYGARLLPYGETLLTRIHKPHWIDAYVNAAQFIHPVVLATSVTLLIQFFAYFFTDASLGRALFGIELAQKRNLFFFRRCFLALAETLTLGGLLTLPLLLVMPSRSPILPWITFRSRS